MLPLPFWEVHKKRVCTDDCAPEMERFLRQGPKKASHPTKGACFFGPFKKRGKFKIWCGHCIRIGHFFLLNLRQKDLRGLITIREMFRIPRVANMQFPGQFFFGYTRFGGIFSSFLYTIGHNSVSK
jgi:hypothetical protein